MTPPPTRTPVLRWTNQRLAILAAEERERELRLSDEVQRRNAAVGRKREEAGEQDALEALVETLESDIDVHTTGAGWEGNAASSQLVGGESYDRSERVDLSGWGIDGQPWSDSLPTEGVRDLMRGGDQLGSGNDDPRGGGGEGMETSGSPPGAEQQQGQQEQKQRGLQKPGGGEGGDKKSGKRVGRAIGMVAAAAYYAVWVVIALMLG